MKIIIVGGGIGGLAAYLALEKYLKKISPSVCIKVYESHPDPTSTDVTIGGSISIAPNGLRALASISEAAASRISTAGFQCPTFTFRDARGALLGKYLTGTKERYGFVQTFVTRASVHEALVKEAPQGAVEWGKNVKGVKETTVGGVEVQFDDGTVEHADLVIGADGVESTVREAIFGDEFDAEYQ
jgi:2-polyprenyl-6-methoxyphenol hydroxylase-like FAD-dependent oxidoreductase